MNLLYWRITNTGHPYYAKLGAPLLIDVAEVDDFGGHLKTHVAEMRPHRLWVYSIAFNRRQRKPLDSFLTIIQQGAAGRRIFRKKG